MDEVILGDALNIGLSGVLQGTHEAKFHLLIDIVYWMFAEICNELKKKTTPWESWNDMLVHKVFE